MTNGHIVHQLGCEEYPIEHYTVCKGGRSELHNCTCIIHATEKGFKEFIAQTVLDNCIIKAYIV